MGTFTGIGRAIKDVTFSTLTTASKTILGAINELNSNMIPAAVPLNYDTSVVTFTNAHARRVGKHVSISGNVRTAYVGVDAQLVYVTEYRPAAITPFVFSSGAYTNTGYINTDGIMRFNTSGMSGSHDLYFNISYVAA